MVHDRHAARVTRADGRLAYEAAPERARQPETPSVKFIGDDPREVSAWRVVGETLLIAALFGAVVLACEVVAAWWGVGA